VKPNGIGAFLPCRSPIPVRASIAAGSSRYTGVKMRQLRRNPELAEQPLGSLIGTKSFNMPTILEVDYME
jgi:hypothetical protein